jgi:hypothetical protein
MSHKRFCAALLLLLVAACASGAGGNSGFAGGRGFPDTLADAITTYRAMEPRLSAEQKTEFKEAYDRVVSAYQMAGTLLASVFDAADEASAHTAMVGYMTTADALPGLTDRVAKLVRGFKGSNK